MVLMLILVHIIPTQRQESGRIKIIHHVVLSSFSGVMFVLFFKGNQLFRSRFFCFDEKNPRPFVRSIVPRYASAQASLFPRTLLWIITVSSFLVPCAFSFRHG